MRTLHCAIALVAILSLAPRVTAQDPIPPAPAPAPPVPAEPSPSEPPSEPAPSPNDATAEQPSIQEPDPVPPEPASVPQQQPPAVLSDAAASSLDRRDPLPEFNVYLPEGQASLRLRRLIRNALFESQIDYEFINGDISTYLRYKYYSRNYTYRIGVFDTIEFPNVGESSTQEFERVRGSLLLVGVPRDYDDRYFWLVQGDALTFGDLTNVDNKKQNFYTKIGYQFGTQFDARLNAIVGESRGRITPVLTAFRDIGPQRTSWAAALTQTFNVSGGDYNTEKATNDYGIGDYRYTKLEFEGMRRFDVGRTSFVFSRLHLGAFFLYDEIRDREERPLPERYSLPRYEMFRLGGREAIRSIDEGDFSIGTHELHITNEYFHPIFRNRDYKMGVLHWNTMYGIAYLGAGTVGFDWNQIAKAKRAVVDAGLGFEAAISIRDDIDVFLTVLWATAVKTAGCEDTDRTVDCGELKGSNFRFSVRTVR